MMSRRMHALFLISLFLVSSAMAAPTVTITGGPYQNDSGGEFTASVSNGGSSGLDSFLFQTFCLEKDEHLSFGSTYDFTINTAADEGGAGGTSPDPLDPKTAWLYNEFLNGTLTGYDSSGPDRLTDAGLLQNAIWALEEEISAPASNPFYDLALASNAASIGDVVVLNLTSYDNYNHLVKNQDVLARVTPATVPAPGALLLSGLGTMVAGYLRRRRAL